MAVTDIILAQAEQLIIAAAQSVDPDLDLRPTTPQYDLLVRPYLGLVANIVERLNVAERKRTVTNWQELNTQEMRAAAARFFLTPKDGQNALGTVRYLFSDPTDVFLTTKSVLRINGLVYNPVADVAFPKETLGQDPVTGNFYADIVVRADTVGIAYNQSIGTPFTSDDFAGSATFRGVIASTPLLDGKDPETNPELYQRILKAQTVRNLINPVSTETVLLDQFPKVLSRVFTVGYQDPEMMRDIVNTIDPVLGPISLHMGNHTDIYVQTPIVRRSVDIFVPAGQSLIDLSPYLAVLKIHGVSVKGNPRITPYYALVNTNPKTRYSALDPVGLFIDPALGGQTLTIDMSTAPDVVTIHNFVTQSSQRVSLANLLVRYFHPVWLNGSIYVSGAVSVLAVIDSAVNQYLQTLTGLDPLIVSRLTQSIHDAGGGSVYQDYAITAVILFGDGERFEMTDAVTLVVPNRYDKGFSQRVAVFLNEGIRITPLS